MANPPFWKIDAVVHSEGVETSSQKLSAVFIRNITPYSPLKFTPRMGGICRLYSQNRAKIEHEEDSRHLFTFSGLQGVVSRKTDRHRNFSPCCIQTHFNPVFVVSFIFILADYPALPGYFFY
jgi:hypothetical protein